MNYSEQLAAEISATIDAIIDAGEPLRAQWIAHTVCENHNEGLASNEHADFWRHGGYKTCRDEVRRCINRRIGDTAEQDDKQLVFDGFEHLQRYYMVTRDGDQIGVPVEHLTDDEIDAKAALYRGYGAACYAHADELHRFKHWRQSPPLFAETTETEKAAV